MKKNSKGYLNVLTALRVHEEYKKPIISLETKRFYNP